MLECRYCREVLHAPLAKIGARCPLCRMPLYERDRTKAPPIDLGPCTVHKDKSAHGKCQRCGKLICAVCRTRWQDELLCTGCLDHVLDKEPDPLLVRSQSRQANLSLGLALAGWVLLLLTTWPLSSLAKGLSSGQASAVELLFLISFVPALCAAGQGAACIWTRGRRLVVATCGVSLAGVQLGLMIGFLVFSVWIN